MLPELESAICDKLPEFGKGDDHLVEETLRIVDMFRNHSMKSRITYLDLSNRFDIEMTVDSSFTVYLGDMNDIKTKLATVESMITDRLSNGYAGGEFNMISPTAFSFKGYFADPEQEDAEKPEASGEAENKENAD